MSELFLRQLVEKTSSTYTYLIADVKSKEAVLIDPVLETVSRDAAIIKELGWTLKYGINTHCHADHITGTGELKKIFPKMKSMISKLSTAKADILLEEGDKIEFGGRFLTAISTPGHTLGCTSYVMDDNSMVFTGDTLMIRGCGRTDFQGGSAETLYASVHDKIFTLPDACRVYPGHDYRGRMSSTVREEKTFNPRLTKDKAGFIKIMDNLNLNYPKKIDVAVPANLKCGIFSDDEGDDADQKSASK